MNDSALSIIEGGCHHFPMQWSEDYRNDLIFAVAIQIAAIFVEAYRRL
jgi:hypothetical protein